MPGVGFSLRAYLTRRLGAAVPVAPPPFLFNVCAGRTEQVRRFCEAVLVPRFRLFRAQQQQAPTGTDGYAAAFVYGQSGMGKSRLCWDLIPQALQYLTHQPGADPELLALLRGCTTLLIAVGHGGERVCEEEYAELPADVIIGLRVAAMYFGYGSEGVRQLALRETGVHESLRLAAVLQAISKENVAAGKCTMLHLGVDEVHHFFDRSVVVPCSAGHSDAASRPRESGIRAVLQAVMGACNASVQQPGLFVVGTFAATALPPPPADWVPMEDGRCLPMPLPPLSVTSMQQVLDDHFSAALPTGQHLRYAIAIPLTVRQAPWFAKVLRGLGGLPRALEHLCCLPQQGQLVSEHEKPLQALRAVSDLLAEHYKFPPQARLLPYLALSGVPLPSLDEVVSPPSAVPTTARTLQRNGYVSIVESPPPATPWVQHWRAAGHVLVDMPLALMLAGLAAQPDPAQSTRDVCGVCVMIDCTDIAGGWCS